MAKILVVDDDAFNLKLAVTVLTQADHEVFSADGGEAGVALALATMPDLLLMDVQMPGVDGLAALKRLRVDARTASLKVIALTALAMKGDRERLLAEGFDGYLEKPIRYKEFLASVAALLAASPICIRTGELSSGGSVIPDSIRDPVPREHWIAGQARNDKASVIPER